MGKNDGQSKVLAQNKKASHDYFIEDTYEAGMVLTGTEIKSLRNGRANIGDAFATIRTVRFIFTICILVLLNKGTEIIRSIRHVRASC